MDQKKVFCRCAKGHCFLEQDAEQAKQNYAQALHYDVVVLDRALLGTLDAERLHKKGKWMGSLGVNGTSQVYCKHPTKISTETRIELPRFNSPLPKLPTP